MAAGDDIKSLLTRSSFWIYVVFILHFALCLLYVTKFPGDRQYDVVEGLTLSQPVQWAVMAFSFASVFFIVQAYIGAVYGLESHLNMYYYLLGASVLTDIGFLFVLVWAWFNAFGLVVMLSLSVVFKLAAMYITSKYSKVVRTQYNAELLPHLKSALGRSFGVAPPEPSRFQPAPDRASTLPEAYPQPQRTMYSEGSPLRGAPQQEAPPGSMGSMSTSQFGATPDYFSSVDRNQDGRVSREELEQAVRTRTAPPQGGSRPQAFRSMPAVMEATSPQFFGPKSPASSRLVRIVQ